MDHEKRQRIIFIDSPRPNAYALDEAYTGCLLKLIADNRSLLVNRGGGGLRMGGGGRVARRVSFFFLFFSFSFSSSSFFFFSYLFRRIRAIDYAARYLHLSSKNLDLWPRFDRYEGDKGGEREREKSVDERTSASTKERFRTDRIVPPCISAMS